LIHLQLRVFEKTEFEQRLAKFEGLMREAVMENRKKLSRKKCEKKG
jgi:hypothetical protein